MKPTSVRYIVLILLALAPFCAYLTRILSAANSTIGREFGVDDEIMGDVLAGFALGYFFFQIPGGMLASAFGVRKVLPTIGIVWSGCALWSSVAASPEQLRLSRIALGFAQAGLVPCCAKVVADWFPAARRGIISAVVSGTMQLGAVAATGLTATLLKPLGWRLVLQGYAVAGIAWAIAFAFWFRNRPEEHPATNEAERDLIQAGRVPAVADLASSPPAVSRWRRGVTLALVMLLNGSLLAYFIQAFFRAYAADFFYSMCPTYLERAYGMDAEKAGVLATYPVIGLGVGSLLGGVLIDIVLVRTGSRWISRSGSASVALCLGGGCFAAATQFGDPVIVTVFLTLGALLASIAGPATWAAGMDLGGRYTPVVFGVMNMIGNIGAYYCPLHVGKLLTWVKENEADWNLVLWLFVGIHAAGAVSWFFVNPRRTIGEQSTP